MCDFISFVAIHKASFKFVDTNSGISGIVQK